MIIDRYLTLASSFSVSKTPVLRLLKGTVASDRRAPVFEIDR